MAETIVPEKKEQKEQQEPKKTGSLSSKFRRKPRRRLLRILLPIIILAVLAAGGYELLKYFGTYESTDDAQVDGNIDPISARISGHIIDVLVEDEQIVKAGDVLVKIDPKDYEVAVAQAEANLADAQAALESSRINVPIVTTNTQSTLDTARSSRADADAALVNAQRQLEAAQARMETAQAQVTEAEANYKKAADDAERYRQLVVKDEIAQQVYDTAVQTAAAAKATIDARKASVSEARQNIAAAEAAVQQAETRIPPANASIQSALTRPQQIAQTEANVKAATARVAQQRAALDQAKLNLSYTIVTAPATGIIGKKTGQVGQNVSPGESLMALVPLEDIWITANFKETQLRHMRAGQKAEFSVDAYDHTYHGHVTGIGGATGSRFSLLPPENATGNYVKVVQRIPVRIDLDPGENKDLRLRPGMSVEPKVYLNR
jgi:membrane fusion protein, multidrug efflux system